MYYQQHLGLDLLKSGIFSVLPWITMAIFANVGGWIADTMIHKGVSVTRVRKIMQSVSNIQSNLQETCKEGNTRCSIAMEQ